MKTHIFVNLLRITSCCAIAAAIAGCDIYDNVPLETNHNEGRLRVVDVRVTALVEDDAGQPVPPRPSGAYNASPLLPAGKQLGAFYQTSGVRAARYPLGWGCDLTLDYVFDYEGGDPTSADAYNLTTLEALSDELVKYSVLPIYQAAWDIGYDGCTKTPTIGVAARTIGMPDNWGRVNAYLAVRLNNLIRRYYNADMLAKLSSLGWKPGYVEIYPDATGNGGYGDLDIGSVSLAYKAFQTAFGEALPRGDAKRLIGVIAPGIRISDASELSAGYSALMDFVGNLPANIDLLPDVISFKPRVDSLESMVSVTRAVRDAVDDAGFPEIPLAAIDASLTPAAWESLAQSQSTVQERSAWLGAFAASSYIRLQPELQTIIPDRWSTLDMAASEPNSGEDLFQDATGAALPALLMLKMVRTFAEEGSEMLAIGNQDADDAPSDQAESIERDDILSVAGARRKDGGYEFLVAALNPSDAARNGLNMRYVVNVTEISTGTTGWEVGILELNSESTGLPSKPFDRGPATFSNGNVSFSGLIKAPALHLIKFFPPVTGE